MAFRRNEELKDENMNNEKHAQSHKHHKHNHCECNECDCEKDVTNNCSCESECNCDENCHCDDACDCGNDCHCGDDCKCDETCDCGCQDGKPCTCEKCSCKEHDDNMQEAYNYLEMAQRIQAEFDNYRKRTQRTEIDARENGICFAVEKLLPVIDSIDNAKRQVKDENFQKALDLINNQIMQSLANLKVEKIDAVGKEFNPHFHNAIQTGNDSTKKDDEILEEFQAGFKLGDKVIRHSVVRVNKL